MDPTLIVAMINAGCILYTTILKVLGDQPSKCNNADENELTAQSVNAVSSSVVLRQDETLQSLERRMDTWSMEVTSLWKRISILYAEGLELDRRADEAISTFGNNVQVIMLFHGLGSIFVQLNYPLFAVSVSVSMVVSFFFECIVALIVNLSKIEKMSKRENDLQRRQSELQNEITSFGATMRSTFSNQGLETLDSNGSVGEVLARIDSLNMNVDDLQRTITGHLELSSNSESNQMNTLFQVAVVAIIYGLSYPMITYYLLYFVGFRTMGPINSM